MLSRAAFALPFFDYCKDIIWEKIVISVLGLDNGFFLYLVDTLGMSFGKLILIGLGKALGLILLQF